MKIIKEGKPPWAGWIVKCPKCESEIELESSDRARYRSVDDKISFFQFDCESCGELGSLILTIRKNHMHDWVLAE